MTEPRRVIIEADYYAAGIWLVTSKEEREAHPPDGPPASLPESDMPPTHLQLTQGLRDDLKAWNQARDDSDEGFWGDVEAWHAWEVQGRELAIRVQDELGTDGWEVLYRMTGRVHRVHPPGSWPAETWEQDVLGFTRHPHPRESVSALRREEEDRFLERLREYQRETGEDGSPPDQP